ncbi:hypothetical protein L6452_33629 [Arctium lappa]|uniref:Uncharacterized protein n=1 Tax=Arctium lappa TaxID=4217 RepID=A0ACB8YGM7_ARCLA|nr:hypothetical protein L6452_33629 [Arctium lappa]
MASFSHHHHPFLLDQTTAFHPFPTTHNFSGHQPTTTAATTCLLDHDRRHKIKNSKSQGSSTSMEIDHDQLAMKRKGNNGISQDTRKGKKKKQKKSSDDDEGVNGYIHVRARSGQATDSHSLAERVL